MSLWVLLVVWAFLFYFVALPRRKRASILPPGPPQTPVLGNLRQMPSGKAPLVFHDWARKYGDVLYLKVPGQSIIIMDSLQAAEDLLEKRSTIYSDRPKFHLYELFGWTSSLTALPYGKNLARHRQMHQSYLSRQKCVDYMPMQAQEARTLARNLIASPMGKYESCLSRFATGIITQIVAGHKITGSDDPYLRISGMVLESLSPVADEWRPTVRELYDFPLQDVKAERDAGLAKPSFILGQLEDMEASGTLTAREEEELKGSAASMFSAGESTTWSALSVFLLAMVLHPECQVKAQEELRAVVGTDRLPDFSDRADLPYVECVFQEIFRWSPGVPLGIPHRCMEDNIYRGMLIPAGSTVFANIKGMTLDEQIYANPTPFCPERYLPPPAGSGEPFFPAKFGFGRRICTGQYLADNSVWIAVVTILATCTISNASDEAGNAIVPEGTVSYGLMSHPDEFKCVLRPCSAQGEGLLREVEDE